jgi:hypothetical protein
MALINKSFTDKRFISSHSLDTQETQMLELKLRRKKVWSVILSLEPASGALIQGSCCLSSGAVSVWAPVFITLRRARQMA